MCCLEHKLPPSQHPSRALYAKYTDAPNTFLCSPAKPWPEAVSWWSTTYRCRALPYESTGTHTPLHFQRRELRSSSLPGSEGTFMNRLPRSMGRASGQEFWYLRSHWALFCWIQEMQESVTSLRPLLASAHHRRCASFSPNCRPASKDWGWNTKAALRNAECKQQKTFTQQVWRAQGVKGRAST